MAKCPNCGHKIGARWPLVLTLQLAFFVLYFSNEYGVLKTHRWISAVLFLAVLVVGMVDGVVRWRYDMKSGVGKSGSTI